MSVNPMQELQIEVELSLKKIDFRAIGASIAQEVRSNLANDPSSKTASDSTSNIKKLNDLQKQGGEVAINQQAQLAQFDKMRLDAEAQRNNLLKTGYTEANKSETQLGAQQKKNEQDRRAALKETNLAYRAQHQEYMQQQREEKKVESIVSGVGIAAGAGIAAATLAMNKYAQTIGSVEVNSSKIQQNYKDWEVIQVKIGRMASDQLLPAMQQTESVVERVVGFVEKNPNLQSVIAIGLTGVAGISALILSAMKLTDIVEQQKQQFDRDTVLNQKWGIAPPVESKLSGVMNTVGAVTLYATAVILGAEGGQALGNLINRLMGNNKPETWGDNAKTAVSMFGLTVLELDKSLHDLGLESDADYKQALQNANGIVDAGQKLKDAIDGVSKDVTDAAMSIEEFAKQYAGEMQAYTASIKQANDDYATQLKDLKTNLDEQSAAIVENTNKAINSITANLGKQLSSIDANTRKQDIAANTAYEKSRLKIISSGHDAAIKEEKDYQKELLALQKEHEKNTSTLIADRDALGLEKEKIAYAEKLSEASTAKDEASAERQKQEQEQLVELRNNFVEQQKERRIAAAQQKAEIQSSAEEQIKQLGEQKKEELAKLNTEYEKQKALALTHLNDQLTQMDQAFTAKMRSLNQFIFGDIAAVNAGLQQAYTDMVNWIKVKRGELSSPSSNTNVSGSHDVGGYSQTGLYKMHDGEFTLSPDTTKMAEGLLGAKLNQQNILGMGGQNLTMIFQLGNGISKTENLKLLAQTKQELLQQISSALPD